MPNWSSAAKSTNDKPKEDMMSKGIIATVLTHKNFWLALAVSATAQIGNACVKQPVVLLGSDLGLSASALGFIASAYIVFAMLGSGPFGNAVDHTRHTTLILSGQYVFRGLIFLGFSLCNAVPLYVVLKFMQGLSFGMGHIAMMLVIAESIDKKALGSAFGLITLIPKLLSSATNGISLQITQTSGASYSCLAGAALSLVPAALCLFLTMPKKETASSPSATHGKRLGLSTFVNVRVIPFGLILVFASIPSLFIDNFLVLYGTTPETAALTKNYLSSYMWWMGIGSFAAGYAFDRFGFKKVAAILIVLATAAQLILGLSSNPTAWILSSFLCGISASGIACATRSYAVLNCPSESTALTVATLSIMQDFSTLLATSLGGIIIDAWSFALAFKVVAFAPLISLPLIIFLLPKLTKLMTEPAR